MGLETISIALPNLLKSKANDSSEKDIPVSLILKRKRIQTLSQLRENFNSDEVIKYHIDGILEKWLIQHYYENEASKIAAITINETGCLAKLCSALGVDYISNANLSEEEKMIYEKKKNIISEYTNDATILSEVMLVALNQEDLAELINRNEKKIYLCKESFSIPIRVPGIEYICIGGANIDNPYTKEQYEKAGIHVRGFELPLTENPETIELAKNAARNNGYDDFHETHSPLATVFHNRLKSYKMLRSYRMPYDSSIASKFYRSKSECEKAKEHCIKKAYADAESHFTTSSSKSISKAAANFYCKYILSAFEDTAKGLEKLSTILGLDDEYLILRKKIDSCYRLLLTKFDKELDENHDFYSMYNFDYFMNQVEIEKHDFRVSEDVIFKTIETLFTDNIEYTITDIYSAIQELESDVNSHANTFFGTAFSIYNSYVTDIEKILDKLGKGLPEMADNEEIDDYLTRCCCIKMTR